MIDAPRRLSRPELEIFGHLDNACRILWNALVGLRSHTVAASTRQLYDETSEVPMEDKRITPPCCGNYHDPFSLIVRGKTSSPSSTRVLPKPVMLIVFRVGY